jgi:hypothetical protein
MLWLCEESPPPLLLCEDGLIGVAVEAMIWGSENTPYNCVVPMYV